MKGPGGANRGNCLLARSNCGQDDVERGMVIWRSPASITAPHHEKFQRLRFTILLDEGRGWAAIRRSSKGINGPPQVLLSGNRGRTVKGRGRLPGGPGWVMPGGHNRGPWRLNGLPPGAMDKGLPAFWAIREGLGNTLVSGVRFSEIIK